jgi:hypothetical protein
MLFKDSPLNEQKSLVSAILLHYVALGTTSIGLANFHHVFNEERSLRPISFGTKLISQPSLPLQPHLFIIISHLFAHGSLSTDVFFIPFLRALFLSTIKSFTRFHDFIISNKTRLTTRGISKPH